MNGLQKVINQIGLDAVKKSMGDIAMGNCTIHGAYTWDMSASGGVNNGCPICPKPNGVTATQVEHYIDMNPVDGTNPGQRINPYGV